MRLRGKSSLVFGAAASGLVTVGVLIATVGSVSAATPSTACAPVPNPTVHTQWVPFGTARWTADGLLTTSAHAPSQPFGVSCGGASVYGNALPTTDPKQITALSFEFSANQTGPSGQSPRLVVCFSDASNCQSNGNLFPDRWTAGVLTRVDGLNPGAVSSGWDNVGGSCGSAFRLSWSQVIACHPGASISQVAVVNDGGSQYPSGEQVLLNNLTVNNVNANALAPVLGQNASIVPTQGSVMVKTPGTHHFKTLKRITRVRYGTTVNATHGRLQVIADRGQKNFQSGVFYDGSFHLTQGKSGVVQAALTGRPRGCPTQPLSLAHDASTPRLRLWGHVKGRYRTRGHYGSASVSGTIWLTVERCSGTFFHVVEGVLKIRDFTLHRTVTLRAGHSYLARSQRPDTFDHDGDYNADLKQGLRHDGRP